MLAGRTLRAVAERALANAFHVAQGRIPSPAGPHHAWRVPQGSMPPRQGPQPAAHATVLVGRTLLAVAERALANAFHAVLGRIPFQAGPLRA